MDKIPTSKEIGNFISERTKVLEEKFPIEACYGSRCSLWQQGWKSGFVTEEEFKMAQKYYGRLWNYVGD